ncbi:MAG: hypothetical protein WCG48_04105 [Candidatus Berkelbacteria bacterium]
MSHHQWSSSHLGRQANCLARQLIERLQISGDRFHWGTAIERILIEVEKAPPVQCGDASLGHTLSWRSIRWELECVGFNADEISEFKCLLEDKEVLKSLVVYHHPTEKDSKCLYQFLLPQT